MTSKTLIAFDYALKYLLRNKAGYEIVEAFISALLATVGYSPVKIKAILESESNREKFKLKRSIADMIVEDQQGEKYIIEIEREDTESFMHKACFNTCRLIVDNAESGTDYTTIKKIFHISLLYFAWGSMTKPMYHGKTIIREVDTQNPVDLHISDVGGKIFDLTHVLPEYFLISVPLFNDEIKKEIDEWLYVMKHSEVKEGSKSPHMKKVAERLSILKMDDADRDDYYAERKVTLTQRDALITAEKKGRAEGRTEGLEEGIQKGKAEGEAKGREEERKTIAKQMHAAKLDIATIEKLTGLSKEALKDLLK